MISIDRESSVPVHLQLSDQLRYQIATGRYQIGARLPSTRALASQLDLSYHTVRAAYRALQDDGIVEGRSGSGFVVRERKAAAPAERMEEGAAVVQEALRRLIGMGIESDDIEYLFQEQFELVAVEQEDRKLLFAAPSQELAELCATQLSGAFQQLVEGVPIDALSEHSDADFVFASFEHVRRVMSGAPRADVRGLVVHLNGDALERIVRLMEDDTLGLIARTPEALASLMTAVRTDAGFGGQMLAFSSDANAEELARLVDQATLVAYTPASRRALLPLLRTHVASVSIRPVVSAASVEALRQVLPL